MDLATIRPILLALIASLSGLPSTHVWWRDAPEPFLPDQHITLRMTSIVGSGVDAVVYPYDAAGDTIDADEDEEPDNVGLTETIQEVREFTLSVLAVSMGHVDGSVAMQLTERVRTRMRMATTLATLNAAHLAAIRVLSSTDLSDARPNPIDQRTRSIANLDIRFRAAASVAGDGLPWIETFETDGTIT